MSGVSKRAEGPQSHFDIWHLGSRVIQDSCGPSLFFSLSSLCFISSNLRLYTLIHVTQTSTEDLGKHKHPWMLRRHMIR